MIYLHVLSFLIINLTLYIDVRTDYRIWLQLNTGLTINHKRGALLRLIGFVPAAALLWVAAEGNIWWHVLTVVSGSAFHACYYILMFDGQFNNVRRYNWWFRGTPHPESARTDIFLHTLSLGQVKVLKVGLAAASLSAYVYVAFLQ